MKSRNSRRTCSFWPSTMREVLEEGAQVDDAPRLEERVGVVDLVEEDEAAVALLAGLALEAAGPQRLLAVPEVDHQVLEDLAGRRAGRLELHPW